MPMTCVKAPDFLEKYHPYTVSYRAPEAELYRDFSPFNPRQLDSYHAYAASLNWQGEREALANALKSYLERLQAPSAALANAARFADNKTVAIVTGHQPSLFGGPLFLMFKLISALQLCQQLNQRESALPETDRFHYIPVYWNASEDHNRSEFCRATVFDQEHDLIHLAQADDTGSGSHRSAAQIDTSEIADLLNKLAEILPPTEFKNEVMDNLKGCMSGSLGEAMSRLVLSWFGEQGLLVVEPQVLRPFARPVFAKALQDWKEIYHLLDKSRQAMAERGYPPPLMLRETETTLVYYLDENGERNRLHAEADGYGYSSGELFIRFETATIFQKLEAHPESFSPSAALRPVMQAFTLPVVAYIAGGGEIAYHCQICGLFQYFGIKIPMLLPRPAGTIIKKSLAKTMQRMGISPEKLLSDRWEWDTILKAAEDKNHTQRNVFTEFKDELDKAFEQLADELSNSGMINLNELARTQERCYENIAVLQKRLEQEDPVLGKEARKRYFRLRKFVLPGERYQDICVWTVYFLACFGKDLIAELSANLDPLSALHHLFIMD
ncbi:MAG: bacillithiol biosynthesis cysteine-adding enzyme BshC [Planctomycetes bacterium]|nr:bacillithiol biosynthesis cysteine-adding enzyme BshC [Planctomycetota bacterium]